MFNLLFIISSIYKNKPNLIFFTGGSNLMPPSIYNNFLKSQNQFNIYTIPSYSNYENRINNIHKLNTNTILMGHSSGCITAINNCPKYIKKIILLDPVITPTYDSTINLDFLEEIIIINAELSYKWSVIPPFFPFIPFFSLTKKNLNIDKNKIKIIEIKNYGHTDILNNPWRDIMHYSRISRGNYNRSTEIFQNYYFFYSNI